MLSVHQRHGRTDRRTDGRHYDSNTALALRASRGKNEMMRITMRCMCKWSSGWLEYRTRNFQVAGSNLTASHVQATLNKLLTYGVLRSTQPPTLRGTGNE